MSTTLRCFIDIAGKRSETKFVRTHVWNVSNMSSLSNTGKNKSQTFTLLHALVNIDQYCMRSVFICASLRGVISGPCAVTFSWCERSERNPTYTWEATVVLWRWTPINHATRQCPAAKSCCLTVKHKSCFPGVKLELNYTMSNCWAEFDVTRFWLTFNVIDFMQRRCQLQLSGSAI